MGSAPQVEAALGLLLLLRKYFNHYFCFISCYLKEVEKTFNGYNGFISYLNDGKVSVLISSAIYKK